MVKARAVPRTGAGASENCTHEQNRVCGQGSESPRQVGIASGICHNYSCLSVQCTSNSLCPKPVSLLYLCCNRFARAQLGTQGSHKSKHGQATVGLLGQRARESEPAGGGNDQLVCW